MNTGQRAVFGGKGYPINTIVEGLGEVVKTAYLFNQFITGSVKRFEVNNNTIFAHIEKGYNFRLRAFQADKYDPYYSGNKSPSDFAPYVKSWEDLDGSLTPQPYQEYVFRNSAIKKFSSPSLEYLDRTFHDMVNIEEFELPNLKVIQTRNFGLNSQLVFDCPPSVHTLLDATGFYDFTESSFANVTNNLYSWPFNHMINLQSIKSLNPLLLETISYSGNRSLMFTNRNLEGQFNFPALTTLNALFPFYSVQKVTSLNLKNVTEIQSVTFLEGGGNSLNYLDLRKCKLMVNHGNFLNCPTNGTIEAHIDLKTDNNGNMNINLETLYNKNWTINWYNDDGSLHSTTN